MFFRKELTFKLLLSVFLGFLLLVFYPVSVYAETGNTSSPQEVKKARSNLTSLRIKKVPTVQLFGHVTLVEGYALPKYTGCHALVKLRDTPGKTIAVLTTRIRLQSLLETALETGNLICVWGKKLIKPPNPRGGTWSVDVYKINGVILYNMK